MLVLKGRFCSRKTLLLLCCILEINFLKSFFQFVFIWKRITLLVFNGSRESQSNVVPGSGKICVRSNWARGDSALAKQTKHVSILWPVGRLVRWMFHTHKNTNSWCLVYIVRQGAQVGSGLHQEVAISLFPFLKFSLKCLFNTRMAMDGCISAPM